MNSTLKSVMPVGQSAPAAPAAAPAKPHAQDPSGYGPNSALASNLVNLAHANSQTPAGHPNPAHQPPLNHYAHGAPNAQHYPAGNQVTIPASNHPLATQPAQHSTAAPPNYSPNKNATFVGGYQPNLGHPPNQNNLPPVSQTIPATAQPPPAEFGQHQSNGTAQAKTPTRDDAPPNAAKKEEKLLNLTSAAAGKAGDGKSEEAPAGEPAPKPEAAKTAAPAVAPPVNPAPEAAKKEEANKVDGAKGGKEAEDEEEEDDEEEDEEDEDEEEEEEEEEEAVQEKSTNVNSKKEKAKAELPIKVARTPPARKLKKPEKEPTKKAESKPVQKSPSLSTKSKRTRVRTQPYQSPLPELEIITKITSTVPRVKTTDDKLIVFYKNEFLAVRNSEGSFYVCQAVQNIYKSSPKIKIRWLSQEKGDKSGEIYTPDFYDFTDFDCILTNLNLDRVDKGKFRLPAEERERTDSILRRSIAVERGEASPSLTEEHPDGIDVSLYKEESQLTKRSGRKRKAAATGEEKASPTKVRKAVGRKAGAKRGAARKSVTSSDSSFNTSGSSTESKQSNVSSRTDRAKRRSDSLNQNKVSPVVDPKKAKVLAKVTRPVINKRNLNNKSTKPSLPAPKPQSSQSKTATRKTKRSTKK